MLPDTDGFAICRSIRGDRSLAAVPIIILTARSEEADRVLGLELGADDYVVKPFSPKELAARVKAVLRRSSPEAGRSRIDVGDGLLIDMDKLETYSDGRRLELTQAEFRILQLLAPASAGSSPGKRSSTISGATRRTSPTGRWTST